MTEEVERDRDHEHDRSYRPPRHSATHAGPRKKDLTPPPRRDASISNNTKDDGARGSKDGGQDKINVSGRRESRRGQPPGSGVGDIKAGVAEVSGWGVANEGAGVGPESWGCDGDGESREKVKMGRRGGVGGSAIREVSKEKTALALREEEKEKEAKAKEERDKLKEARKVSAAQYV